MIKIIWNVTTLKITIDRREVINLVYKQLNSLMKLKMYEIFKKIKL